MLMSAHDRAVDHRVFIVGIICEMLKDTLPDAGFCPSAQAPVHVFPIPKALWKIAPGDTGTIPEKHSLDEQSIVRRRYADRT
jgi:hypothetical protein